MSFLYTADWHEIGPKEFFRRVDLYTMAWTSQVDLDNFAFVGGSFGGPMAIIQDDKKFLRVTPSVPVKPIISLYTPSGNLISSIKWDSGILMKMGWSSAEELLCVQEDGNVLVYSIFGQAKTAVHILSNGGKDKEKVQDVEIFPSSVGTGIAILTTNGHFRIVNNYKDPKVRRYPKFDNKLIRWGVISEANKQVQIVAFGEDGSVHLIDASHSRIVFPQFNLPKFYVNKIGISLDGRNIALLSQHNNLWLGSTDFEVKFTEVTLEEEGTPKDLVWCGTEAVAVSWDSDTSPRVILVNKKGEKLVFPVESRGFGLVPEIDSVRIVTNFGHEIIQKVSEAAKDIFGIGSTKPGALLVDAAREFSEGSHKADEYMRCIGNVESAVKQCIEAAGYEFHPPTQKMLIKAAQFGKSFLTKFDPEEFVHMCQMLRIINAMKDYKISIPLTYTQLDTLGMKVLVDRLVNRRQYPLALKIVEFLKFKESQGKSRILAHWACYKVSQAHIDEATLAREIYGKLKSDSTISYSEIALKALDANRKNLALKLAEYEARPSVQVSLFLKLGDNRIALHKAVESGDADLIYKVLLQLRDNMPLSEFQMLIRNFPMAQSLYIKYCESHNPEAVRDIYEQEDNFACQAALSIKESYKEKRVESRISSLLTAQKLYTRGKNDFMASACEDHHKLLKFQQSLQQKFDGTFIDLSLRDTIRNLLTIKEYKLADNLRTQFKVSEKMFWWIKLTTLGEIQDWAEIDKLSKIKKMPGTFEDIVEVCLQFGNKNEAKKYLPKVKDHLQIKYYLQAGFYEEAARLAYERKEEDSFQLVYAKCLSSGDRAMAEKLKNIMEQGKISQ